MFGQYKPFILQFAQMRLKTLQHYWHGKHGMDRGSIGLTQETRKALAKSSLTVDEVGIGDVSFNFDIPARGVKILFKFEMPDVDSYLVDESTLHGRFKTTLDMTFAKDTKPENIQAIFIYS